MNILRWNRKSKNKIKPKRLLLLVFSLIMTTFAWFAYSKVLEPTLNIHLASWNMEYKINGQSTTNPISIEIPVLYPTMAEKTVVIDILNNGETDVDIEYQVKSLTIAGITYQGIQEGADIPASGNYIYVAPAQLDTIQKTEQVIVESMDEETGEIVETTQDVTTTVEVYKGAITNDITKFPFTIEVEHSPQVEEVMIDDYGVKVPGEGYLKVTVKWTGDNDRLDSEWGYKVGQYLAENADKPAMSIVLSIDSYQADPDPNAEIPEPIFPSTSSTKPYLPTGYKRVVGTTLDSGLVVEDSNGNQFVWVEVPRTTQIYETAGIGITDFSDTTVYDKIETDLRSYVGDYSNRVDQHIDYDAIGLSEPNYNTLKQKMLKSIYNYGGFYIGRYETGIASDSPRTKSTLTPPTDTPVIKANAYPFNFLTCSQANSKSDDLAPDGYTSSLMFGLQWDLVMKYLETKGTPKEWLTTDSSLIGNYKSSEYTLINTNSKYSPTTSVAWQTTIPYAKYQDDNTLITSGGNSSFCCQNIYDLAGNLAEWTYNIISLNSAFVGGNGGCYLNEGTENTANSYGTHDTMKGVKEVGFRIVLFSDADVAEAWGDNS